MASGVKIVFTMGTPNGDKTFSYSDAKSSATITQVKAFAQALVTNGSIFENVPSEVKAAKLITTTEEEYDLS